LARECGPEALTLVASARGRVLATSSKVPRGFEAVLQVPPLHARPLDVPAMADAFLGRARVVLGRPRLHLGPDALPLLASWAWPGNVRELKNVMFRAARAAVRDEVSRDSLPGALSALAPREDLRGAMLTAEREALLDALARTRWNVTAAATRLGMPRRTLVYRMARLGLKRPAR
jgi:sigma-54-dependent transcriptional regulator